MIAETTYCFGHISNEQAVIQRIEVKPICRKPKIIHNQHSVLITKLIEHFFRTLTCPVTNHVIIHILMQLQGRFQSFPGNSLHTIIHAPVTSFTIDSLSIHFYNHIFFHQ